LLATLVLSVLLHWNIWDCDLIGIHAWRQTQTMTVVENFANEDMNILNPRINSRGDGDGIFRMEFPLMQWCFAVFYKTIGNHLILARLLTFLISIFSILGFYRLLLAWKLEPKIAAIGSWCFAWSPVFFYYSVNPLPDNMALCFAIWSLVWLKQHQHKGGDLSLALFAFMLAIATAVKLPYILFGAGYIPVFFGGLRERKIAKSAQAALLVLLLLLPALAWYAWVIPTWTNTALIGGLGVEESFDYQSAFRTIWGTLHSLLPELFINFGSLLFFFLGVWKFFKQPNRIKKYCAEVSILFFLLAYYLYEVNMIGLAHDYYLFPFLPILFLIVAAGLNSVLKNRHSIVRYIGLFALLILPATAYLRIEGRWSPMGFERVLLSHKQELKELIPSSDLVVVGNDPSTHIFLYHIEKKGWTYEQDWLLSTELQKYIDRGAKYLITNSDFVQENESINQFTANPLFDKDGIRVYPLIPLSDF